jgi:hypothetical protein
MASLARVPLREGKRICEEYKAPMCVLFAIHEGNRFSVMTYGMTKALCRCAADYGNKIAEAILGSKIAAALNEPTHLPDYPEGWVQDTLPKRLRDLAHKYRTIELEMRSEGRGNYEYRELLLECADDVDAALNADSVPAP